MRHGSILTSLLYLFVRPYRKGLAQESTCMNEIKQGNTRISVSINVLSSTMLSQVVMLHKTNKKEYKGEREGTHILRSTRPGAVWCVCGERFLLCALLI